jgi:hypothetical protein
MTTQGLPPTGTGWRPTKAWAIDTGERIARTFIQAFLGGLTVSAITGISGWKAALSAGVAAVYSLVVSVVAPQVSGSTVSAALLPRLGLHTGYGADTPDGPPEPAQRRTKTVYPAGRLPAHDPPDRLSPVYPLREMPMSRALTGQPETYPDATTEGATPVAGEPSATIFEDALVVAQSRAAEQQAHDGPEPVPDGPPPLPPNAGEVLAARLAARNL